MPYYIKIFFLILLFSFLLLESCKKPETLTENDYNEWLSGGSQTVFDKSSSAFKHEFPFLREDKIEIHEIGDALFEAQFISAPSVIRPGLGPVFNSNACSSCHIADGRGKPIIANETSASLLFRISIPGSNEHGGPNPVPGFGEQLQTNAIYGTQAESGVTTTYTNQFYFFDDSTNYELQIPTYTINNSYISMPSDIMISPRLSRPVFGLGLLESITEEDILDHADEYDANSDGISGKANYVWDIQEQKLVLGRFGWKAGQPSIIQQAALAFNQDMGITNFLFPNENCYDQTQYDKLNDEYEISDSLLYAIRLYLRTLAVPARRNADDETVLKGKQIFTQARCYMCHRPMSKTKVNVAFPELSNQTIFPYTDLLLHDMGPSLADNRSDFLASGEEWRTPPLWGIGLTESVNGHTYFLHDGRARSLIEAVMWHGGEAESAKIFVKALSQADRDALIKFLESL